MRRARGLHGISVRGPEQNHSVWGKRKKLRRENQHGEGKMKGRGGLKLKK